MSARQVVLWLSVALCAGCTPNAGPSAVAPANPDAAAAPDSSSPADSGDVTSDAPPADQEKPAEPDLTSPPSERGNAADAPAANEAERTAAKAGVGKQGQSLQGHSGVMVEAAKAYFNVRQRAVFEMQIPSAMKLFEASEGRKPQTHDEFMTKIIAANSIALPNLPAGNRYIYDPLTGELMVEKPAK